LGASLDWLVRTNELSAVLPGVYTPPAIAAATATRIRAAAGGRRWSPDLVLTGPAAASVSFWPSVAVPVVTAAVTTRRLSCSGFAFSRRVIPVNLIEESNGLRYTSPALTALDLCELHDGNGIHRALRTRAATLEAMRGAMALTSKRLGNPVRRRRRRQDKTAPKFPDLLKRDFTAAAPNTRWVGDMSEIRPDPTAGAPSCIWRR